jgi:spermidine synthase
MSVGLISYQTQPLIHYPNQISNHPLQLTLPNLVLSHRPIHHHPLTAKSQQTHHSSPTTKTQDDGIPVEDVKILARFKSRHNYIRVLEVSRKADHPFAGSRLLLLDRPGNIHSISFLFKKSLTSTYFDVFATLPPILPPGPVGILGFGAGSSARLCLELYPELVVHGWELDPSVIAVGREFFGLAELEKQHPNRLFVYVGNALKASVRDGLSGIFVDLFSKGSLIPELQDPITWEKLSKCLRKGGRVMVNVGGSCVEAEDSLIDGKVVMQESLKAMQKVFGDKLFVLSLGNRKDDSSIALTGDLPNLDSWKKALPHTLRCYVDMWTPFRD